MGGGKPDLVPPHFADPDVFVGGGVLQLHLHAPRRVVLSELSDSRHKRKRSCGAADGAQRSEPAVVWPRPPFFSVAPFSPTQKSGGIYDSRHNKAENLRGES